MTDVPAPAIAAQTVQCLHLVQFYLPRLVATQAPPLPEQWWHALALQKMGMWVLEELPSLPHLQTEHLLVQRWLDRLRWLLWNQLGVPPAQRDSRSEGADWLQAQQLLRLAMPRVESLLLEEQQAWHSTAAARLAEPSAAQVGQSPRAAAHQAVWGNRFEGLAGALNGLLKGLDRMNARASGNQPG